MSYYGERQANAVKRVQLILAIPLAVKDEPRDSDDEFDPWRLFPALFGNYSMAFDNLAIEVLENIRDNIVPLTETLAHEMFREMCCTADLCDYGTSPRGCFATPEFKTVLPMLIDKWKEYRDIQWSND